MKRIVVLGSTGSIGKNALRVIKNLGDEFTTVALSCESNAEHLAQQALQFHPKVINIGNKDKVPLLRNKLQGSGIKILSGKEGLCKIAEMEEVDLILNGIIGSAGFNPTLAAIKKGKRIALANKETLVSYGNIIMDEVKKNKSEIIPVDSEHSAIFQCINGRETIDIKRIILTSSGGPFRKRKDLHDVTIEETLNHPVWRMGKKISVDSATMMNKALEIIEAHFLFSIPAERITVVIHPQCIIHSAVEFVDNSIIAQLSNPDMTLPIQYALTYPERKQSITKALDLSEISTLTFESAPPSRFPAISLAYRSIEKGGTTTAVLNSSNEFLVESFLKQKISLDKITEIIQLVIEKHTPIKNAKIDEIKEAEEWAKREAEQLLTK
ncbi:1-deoxy-D-xylulose-5-phosphate reductoisomerase [candidate division WOR-3 bacterium]|nr:1-deoxy-D-xylulose-5-phosphate reductoisomerase [candidate division WOR-3 bacterium]